MAAADGCGTDVLKADFRMTRRHIVVAHDRKRSDDRDARRVHGHQDHRLLQVRWFAAVRLAHQDPDLASFVESPSGPPLAPIDHIPNRNPENE